jgi:hypothetical protein
MDCEADAVCEISFQAAFVKFKMTGRFSSGCGKMVVMATSEKLHDRADGAERVDEIVK